MLEELRVKNYALIDNLSVSFKPGFNVLTGETGAGKSILIDALSLVLGGKGKVDSVRQGCEEAEVSAVLRISRTPELEEWCARYNISPEDDSLVVRRTLRTNGRGIASIQAVPVTRNVLEELAGFQVDIHGQHEHQSLFQIAVHRRLLDRYAGLEEQVSGFTAKFSELTELGKRIEELRRDESILVRETEFLRRALSEIESAGLRDGEEEELEQQQKILARHEEFVRHLQTALEASSESRDGALSLLRKTRQELNGAAAIDPALAESVKRFDGVFYELEDIIDELRQYEQKVSFDPDELNRIDTRLAQIKFLEKKYSVFSSAEILAFAEQARVKIEDFESRDSRMKELGEEKTRLQEQIIAEAKVLSQKRNEAASSLQEKIEKHLRSLGMNDARFIISLTGKRSGEGKTSVGPYGMDEIEFLLSANRGEAPKPLRSVASGGELSRVMLALKTVLSESDPVQTMVFDEVDSGIGGEIAVSVGEHLHNLSSKKQVFCITHLASIAVFADNHLQVAKESIANRMVTRVKTVRGESRVQEVARMLAGDKENAASRDHASRLLKAHGW
ncbi:MAG: DNA repair protein RecN [Spirochaeta sp. LUC14_002_19_P3]|nr:MAG: DNA repair protein RecN [Spirochaeta sp. LUC14_002_19_P3]